MSTNIQFPQGPMVDTSGYVTLEWQQWLQNPQFLTFSLTSTLNVSSGGTGTSSLTLHGVLFGNGTSSIGATAAGADNTILQGNTGSAPTYKNTINNVAIGGTTPAAGAFTTLSATGHVTVEGVTSTGATGSGKFVFDTSSTFTTPAIGVATGTSLAVTGGLTSSSASAGIGYATGAGSTISQSTDKSTTVVINANCGTITMNAASLGAATIVSFTVTNSACAATDVVATQHDSGGTIGAYTITANTPASGSFKIAVRNNTAGPLSEAVVIRFAIIKAVTA